MIESWQDFSFLNRSSFWLTDTNNAPKSDPWLMKQIFQWQMNCIFKALTKCVLKLSHSFQHSWNVLPHFTILHIYNFWQAFRLFDALYFKCNTRFEKDRKDLLQLCVLAWSTYIKQNVQSKPKCEKVEDKAPAGLSKSLHFTWFTLNSTISPPSLNLTRCPINLLW